MPTTWQAVGPRNPTSWSGRPSRPSPTSGSGKSSPCSGPSDDDPSTALPPPAGTSCPDDHSPADGADGKRAAAHGQRATPPPALPTRACRRSAVPRTAFGAPPGPIRRPEPDPGSARLGAPEVLRGDGVEELAELLDLVLLLVRDDQTGLGEHALVGVDRHPDAERERHRVTRSRGHGDPAVEDQLGVERALLKIGDPHLLQPPPERADHVLEQVVGQRTGGLDPLLLQRDRGRLHRADPDRQVAVALRLPQQEDGLVGGQFDPDSHDTHLAHAPASSPWGPTCSTLHARPVLRAPPDGRRRGLFRPATPPRPVSPPPRARAR